MNRMTQLLQLAQNELVTAYDLRQLSDYEETVLLTQSQAETVLTSAQCFVAQAEHYCDRLNPE